MKGSSGSATQPQVCCNSFGCIQITCCLYFTPSLDTTHFNLCYSIVQLNYFALLQELNEVFPSETLFGLIPRYSIPSSRLFTFIQTWFSSNSIWQLSLYCLIIVYSSLIRSFEYLLSELAKRRESYVIKTAFIEVYNEKVLHIGLLS